LRKRTDRRSTDVASAATDVRTADMTATMAAASRMMTATAMMAAATTSRMMTTAVTAATMAAAAFRNGKPTRRQHGRENNDGNLDTEFWHGNLTRCATTPRHVRTTAYVRRTLGLLILFRCGT
jgi:hypothetical protein